jgi:ElaA protein
MTIAWTIKPFDRLSARELHDALRLRVDTFVVEQRCAYAEVDGRDPEALHVMGHAPDGRLVAYARVLPPSDDAPARIGRVVVVADQRGRGLAHHLMERALDAVQRIGGSGRCILSAQAPLEGFYAAHGFRRTSADYDWDGIPHVDMERAG